jgi:carboxyl-terminal processing protease
MKYNNSKKSIFLPIIISISVVFGVLIGNYLPGKISKPLNANLRSGDDKIGSIMDIIEMKYVDEVSKSDLEEAAIPVILQKLDPHSVYIPAKDIARANEPLEGNFDGIGISFNMFSDTILIVSTIPGGPSEKMGLMPGDKILYVNDSLVAGKKIPDEEIMGLLKGPSGTTVRIKILRKGYAGLIPFEIVRDKIPIYSVDVAYMVNETTGYIKINAFAVTTFDEFMKGLRELKANGIKSLIIDLRNNSGGVMDAATRIADQFLQKGQLIVYTEGRAYPREEIRATGTGEFGNGNLVILIDEWSASASEILAGAIQDNDRGTIIGRRSFGKGLVQAPMLFNDGSGMRLTIARYYTPTGRSIQKPYNNGYEEYINDLNDRFVRNEEFVQSDSLYLPDSLRYITPGGKVVYGGGGIMPDKFVPLDTTGVSSYFVSVRNAGLIYRFALKYTEDNRTKLLTFTETGELEEYLDKQAILDKFIKFAESNGIKKDAKGLKISGEIMHIQIKAYIARNILDNKGFYPIWENIDTTLGYAIEFLKGDS